MRAIQRSCRGPPSARASSSSSERRLPSPGCRSASLDPVDLGLTGVAGTQPHHYPVHGIDVSKYQGKIAWDTVRAGGVAFAYIKSTEGGDRVDSAFAPQLGRGGCGGRAARRLPLLLLVSAGRGTGALVHRERAARPGRPAPVLDVEWTPDSPTCTRRPPREEMVREMTAFMDTLEKHYGVRPSSMPDRHPPRPPHRHFPKHQFWLRGVKDHPSVNYAGREDWRFWQWTATGTVPGVSGEVDRNAFFRHQGRLGDLAAGAPPGRLTSSNRPIWSVKGGEPEKRGATEPPWPLPSHRWHSPRPLRRGRFGCGRAGRAVRRQLEPVHGRRPGRGAGQGPVAGRCRRALANVRQDEKVLSRDRGQAVFQQEWSRFQGRMVNKVTAGPRTGAAEEIRLDLPEVEPRDRRARPGDRELLGLETDFGRRARRLRHPSPRSPPSRTTAVGPRSFART